MDRIKVLAVVGPTASGKSTLAVELAKRFDGEIVSCDSMQIYQQMAIATAKPTVEQMQGVPHHLIDFLEPSANFSVADYVVLADAAIRDIAARGKVPILCGGTGLYYSALTEGVIFSNAGSDENYRRQLEERASAEGAQALLDELAQYDPESAQTLHPNNLKRIIRAMEHYHLTGQTITEQNRRSKEEGPRYEMMTFEIRFHERQHLYDRINNRVDEMMAQGLLEEAKQYFALRDVGTISAAIGYKELKPYFEGKITLPAAVEHLKQETRHYAKRQMTWFRRKSNILPLYADDAHCGTLLEQAEQMIKKESFLV